MAGKHTGAFSPIPVGSAAVPGFEWNERTTKAYAEGRSNQAANGHPINSDADAAWKQGQANAADPAFQFETAISAGSPVDPDVADVLARMAGSADNAAITAFVLANKSAGNWALMTHFNCYALNNATDSLVDWIAGTAGSPLLATAETNGAGIPPAHQPGIGWEMVENASYIETNKVLSDAPASNTNAVGGVSYIGGLATGGDVVAGAGSGGIAYLNIAKTDPEATSGTVNYSLFYSATDTGTYAAVDGQPRRFSGHRTGNNQSFWHNGVEIDTATRAALEVVAVSSHVSGWNNGGTHQGGSAGVYTSHMSGAYDTGFDHAAYDAALAALLAAL